MTFVKLSQGSWQSGNFIGKSMQCPRYQAAAQFSCSVCKSTWQSSNATCELIIQKLFQQETQVCDSIVRVYAQICRTCGHSSPAELEKKSFCYVIERMVNDIIAFYIDAVPAAPHRPLIVGEKRRTKEPHNFQRCIACLQGACVRTWQVPEFEMERLQEILSRQVGQQTIMLTSA